MDEDLNPNPNPNPDPAFLKANLSEGSVDVVALQHTPGQGHGRGGFRPRFCEHHNLGIIRTDPARGMLICDTGMPHEAEL